MAQTNGSSKFSFLSLTGYLDMYQKGRLFRKQYKRYWFWFDEKTCFLKYYRNQEAYVHQLNEPISSIDMRFAKVTPSTRIEAGTGNEFQISVDSQVYTLAATDTNAAHTWIKKLQDKRSEWIKASSAKEVNTMDQVRERKTMKPIHEWQGGILGTTPEGGEDEEDGERAPRVRGIVFSQIASTSLPHNRLFPADPVCPTDFHPDIRRCTVPITHSAPPPSMRIPLHKSMSDGGEFSHHSPPHRKSKTPEPYQESDSHQQPYHSIPPGPFSEEERKRLKLEYDYFQAREEVTKLHKEVIRLQDKVEKRDREIVDLNKEKATLKEELVKLRTPHCDLRLENESLKDIIEKFKRSVNSLDDEIELHKLHQSEHDRRIQAEKQRVLELERELSSFKAKYVQLLSDKFKITLPNPAGPQEDEVDPDEELFNKELLKLMKQEGGDDPIFDNYKSNFEDQYGDLHDWQSGTVVQHYLCRQMFLHYRQQEQEDLLQEWEEYLSQTKKTRSRPYPELPVGNDRSKKREFRNLLRKGIPIQHRTKVWTSLIYRQVARYKEVKDGALEKGTTYYQSLLKSRNASLSEKQIKLDLYRTLPSNRHFKFGGEGAPKLENILVAYSLHNKIVGYCQGMNMLVAIALLFLDEETAFWFMVVVIEKLLPHNYYTPGLMGAQADQAVVRELVAEKLPRLNAHLQEYSIDVTLVTFNWFLTLYIDALPTESVLRILDCFLFEGPKVLFRVCLGILRLNMRRILNLTDPVTLFQFLKEIARHTFDVEALFNVAFNELRPFPSRNTLSSRHQHYLVRIRDDWNVREREREAQAKKNEKLKQEKKKQSQLTLLITSREQQQARRHLVWECGCVRGRGEAWLACGERQVGRLGIVTVAGSLNLEIPKTDINSRVICVHVLPCDMVLLGTLDFILHAFDCKTRKELWSVKLNDSILDIEATDSTIFAALADGFVAAIQKVDFSPPVSETHLFRIGSTPVPCLTLTGSEELWCGCGKSITVMSAATYEPLQSLVMEDSAGRVSKMEAGEHGIWVTFRSSSVVCLFDVEHYVKLLQVDYTTLLGPQAPGETTQSASDHRITSIMVADKYLWVGTGSGCVLIFSVTAAVPNPRAKISQLVKQSSEFREPDTEARAPQSGGLLTKVAEELTSPEVNTRSRILERQSPDREVDTPRRFQPRETNYDKRRKTHFGRTLRRDVRREKGAEGREPSVYRLVLEASKQLVEATNEAVRVILPLRDGEENFAVTCVHSTSEQEKTVQVWRCPNSEAPKSWSFGYLPSYDYLEEGLMESPLHHISQELSLSRDLPGTVAKNTTTNSEAS